MTKVYLKGLKKKWMRGILYPLLAAILIPLIAYMWPSLQDQLSAFSELLESPVYKAILGQLGLIGFGTFEGAIYMYIFSWTEMLMIFVTIFVPVRIISAEVDENTLDVILSYPIPRWRYILEKFGVYLTYNLLYPILMILLTLISAATVNETINLLTFTYSVIGVWFLFFALGSISLLCGALFLKSKKALTASGIIIFSQYILVRVGGMVDAAAPLKYFSLLNYLNAGTIVNAGTIPIGELLIVIAVGIIALVGALYIFQKRELAF
ncbi:MAG: ABC transporter permease subunit [Candidatus Lokiarchaeota archaeon]|nr:ABC transporter permease subunit [Candidatus Lokiarchaeota archaeon]